MQNAVRGVTCTVNDTGTSSGIPPDLYLLHHHSHLRGLNPTCPWSAQGTLTLVDIMNDEGVADEEQPQDTQKLFAEREAIDLRELHLSATFLTPFAIAAMQDNDVWLSNNQRDYKDHWKQGNRRTTTTSTSEHSLNRPVVSASDCYSTYIYVSCSPAVTISEGLGRAGSVALSMHGTSFSSICRRSFLRELQQRNACCRFPCISICCFLHFFVFFCFVGANRDMTPVVVKKKTDMVRWFAFCCSSRREPCEALAWNMCDVKFGVLYSTANNVKGIPLCRRLIE